MNDSQKINEDYIKRNYEFFSKNKDNLNSQISKYYSISVEEYIENKEDYLNEILPLYDCINNLKNHGYNCILKPSTKYTIALNKPNVPIRNNYEAWQTKLVQRIFNERSFYKKEIVFGDLTKYIGN